MLMYKTKKAEPFDTYLEFGYRQVDHSKRQARIVHAPLSVNFRLLVLVLRMFWRYSTPKNKSKSSISIL